MGRFRNSRFARRRAGAAPFDREVEREADLVERETEEFLTSALQDSDSPAEIIHDSADDSTPPGARRLLLPLIGLALSVSGVLAARSLRARRHKRRKLDRLRDATRIADRLRRR